MNGSALPNGPRFDNVLNFRDVGRFVNESTKTTHLKPGLLFRSARLDEASPKDKKRLVEEYQLRTVIDLRSKTEHIQAANRHATSTYSASPITIPSLSYNNINFNGHAFSMALMRQLPILSAGKLISLMALGYRESAISILSTRVMAPRGLIGLGKDSLMHCTSEIQSIFQTLATPSSYPVLIHCTQGKDRTGLTVLLVLLLCGVSREVIKRDYMLSQDELKTEREERLVEIKAIGLPDSFADCPDGWVDAVCQFIEDDYGGVEKYLLGCGVTKEMQESVRATLLI